MESYAIGSNAMEKYAIASKAILIENNDAKRNNNTTAMTRCKDKSMQR